MAHYLQQETGAFHLLTGSDFTTSLQTLSAVISSDILSTGSATFPVGPTVTLGSTGTWLVNATLCYVDTAAAKNVQCIIGDGNVVYASAAGSVSANNTWGCTSMSAIVVSTSASIFASARVSGGSATFSMVANKSNFGLDTSITAVRLVG